MHKQKSLYFCEMGKRGFKILWMFSVFAVLFACEEEEQCTGCNLNPKIKLAFEATATKEHVENLVDEINEKIELFEDSLGTQLTDEVRISIQEQLITLRADSILVNEEYGILRAGEVKMESIEAKGALDGFEQFQDSVINNFSIPVDMHHDTSLYYFSYHGLVDTLQLVYQRNVTQTFDGVRMRISEIGVNEELSTFDSVQVKCYNTDCSNDLTRIYVYF